MIEKKINIQKLTLQAAIACNLKCEYCIVSKNSNNPILHELENNTIEALKNGEYLKNTLKCLKRLEQNPKNIKSLEIWGQEPTLILPYFTQNFEDWYNEYPNINYITFSTNGVKSDIVDVLFNYIKKVDSVVRPGFRINIQFSYDSVGQKARIGSSQEVVKNHLIELHKKLNTLKLKNAKVFLFVHTVISDSIIDYCSNFENIKTFYDDINDFYLECLENNINGNVKQECFTFQYMNGGYQSFEDGLKLSETCERMERFLRLHQDDYKYFQDFPMELDIGANVLGVVSHRFPKRIRDSGCKTLDEYVNKFINDNQSIIYGVTTEFCGSVGHDLKVMYDGTSTTCQNLMFDAYNFIHNKNSINYSNNIMDESSKYMVSNQKHCLNLLTATDEEIEAQKQWFYSSFHENNTMAMFNIIANMMFIMAQVGQISRSYLDDLSKIKRHAFLMAPLECCYYNLMVATGSIIVHPASQIRYLCNGLMDKAEEYINTTLKRQGEIPDGYTEC